MVMDESKPKTEGINCPFLTIVRKNNGDKDFESLLSLVSGCSKNDMQYIMALVATFENVSKQKGMWKALWGGPLDLYALNQVEGISHPDKYGRYLDDTKKQLEERANSDGQITLQDLVDVKKWIATEKEGMMVEQIIDASRNETALAFLGGGGDIETWTVKAEDVMTFFSGIRPEAMSAIRLSDFSKAVAKAKW